MTNDILTTLWWATPVANNTTFFIDVNSKEFAEYISMYAVFKHPIAVFYV